MKPFKRCLACNMDYLSELLKAAGISVICAVCLLIVGRLQGGASSLLRIGGTVVICGMVAAMLGSVVGELKDVFSAVSGEGFGHAFSLMLKALGIALISRFCADICRDSGESTLAGGVESVGRIAIFSLCIPVLSDILEYAAYVLKMGD